MLKELKADSVLVQRPFFGATVLRRCANCHAPHPLAMKPPVDTNVCPQCGTNVTRPDTVYGKVTLTGWRPSIVLARVLFWASDALITFSQWLRRP